MEKKKIGHLTQEQIEAVEQFDAEQDALKQLRKDYGCVSVLKYGVD